MQIPIKSTSDGIGYASKTTYEWEGKQYEPDIQDGDVITIKDEGTVETGGKFGEQFYFKIEARNGVKKAAFNQSSLNILAGAWGQESSEWVGKQVRVLTRKAIIAGERRLVAYFVTDGWYIDEWGDLVKDEPKVDYDQPPQFDRSDAQIDPTEADVPDVEPKVDHLAQVREIQQQEPKTPTV